jgi:hypothetical protein
MAPGGGGMLVKEQVRLQTRCYKYVAGVTQGISGEREVNMQSHEDREGKRQGREEKELQ